MSGDTLGLTAAVSIALGGMIGGGIYAVLGVVAELTGPATWIAFVAAGVVALAAGYSFVTLNAIDDEHDGGAVSFVQRFVGHSTLAGMVGWTLLVGYVGSMAMYAFAFGEFAVQVAGVEALGPLPLRPAVSVAAVGLFVGLNLLGARASGSAENVLVGAKVLVLVLFGLAGIGFLVGLRAQPLALGNDGLVGAGPIMAAAVSFVAFQGWQLLFYDQEQLADPVETIRKGVYVAIPAAVAIYVLVAVATVNLVPAAITARPHTALAEAAGTILEPAGIAWVGSVAISLSALFSTGSAINATLFSTGYFAKHLLSDGLLPDQVGEASADGIPSRTLLGLGLVTAALSVLGTLGAITAFASLAFILVFGGVNLLAFRERARDAINPLPPAVGALGSLAFFPLLLFHLYRAERGTFYGVVGLSVLVLAAELLYFERDWGEEVLPVEPLP
jgi:amino acid transporter